MRLLPTLFLLLVVNIILCILLSLSFIFMCFHKKGLSSGFVINIINKKYRDVYLSCRRFTHHAGHRSGPAGRTVGQILRPVQLRGRDRETGAQPAAGTDDVVRPVGQRPGVGAAHADQRPADAAAGRVRCGHSPACGHAAPPLDQVEIKACVPHVVQSRLDRRHRQPVFAGIAAHRCSPVRKQPRFACAHARQAHGQVVAQTFDRAQGDRHRAARTAPTAATARPVVTERH